MKGLLSKEFVVVAGKGGVGRTTVSLIIGSIASKMGKRVLVCLANAPSRYRRILGGIVLNSEIRKVSGSLYAVNIDPVSAREEYGLLVLKNRILHRIVFGSNYVNSFLDAVPGLSEWAMLGKATYHALDASVSGASQKKSDADRFDMVIFDSPATGHGLDILSLPSAIVGSVPTGRMRDEALLRLELMGDASRCEIVPVTTLEDMPVNETIELVTALKKRELPVQRLVVNRVSREERLISEELGSVLGDGTLSGDIPEWAIPVSSAFVKARRQTENQRHLNDTLSLPMLELPEFKMGSMNERALLHLTKYFVDALAAHSA